MRGMFVLAGVLLLPGIASAEECAPAKMAKIVFRNASPGLDAKSIDAKPRTLYRLGSKYGRMEEPLDEKDGFHGLIVAAERDTWMIDLGSKSGQHAVDPVTPYRFQAPVFGDPSAPDAFKEFEFGCELAYMRGRKVEPKKMTEGARALDSYSFSSEGRTILLTVLAGTTKPLYATFSMNGKEEMRIQYVQYDQNLAPDMRLFAPPKGVTITEAPKAAPAPAKDGPKPK